MHLSLSAMPHPAKLVVGGNYEGSLKPGSMPFALYREFLLVMSRFDCPYRRELDDPLIYTYVLPHWVRVRHNSVSYIIIKHYILNFIKHCINQKTKTKKKQYISYSTTKHNLENILILHFPPPKNNYVKVVKVE